MTKRVQETSLPAVHDADDQSNTLPGAGARFCNSSAAPRAGYSLQTHAMVSLSLQVGSRGAAGALSAALSVALIIHFTDYPLWSSVLEMRYCYPLLRHSLTVKPTLAA